MANYAAVYLYQARRHYAKKFKKSAGVKMAEPNKVDKVFVL